MSVVSREKLRRHAREGKDVVIYDFDWAQDHEQQWAPFEAAVRVVEAWSLGDILEGHEGDMDVYELLGYAQHEGYEVYFDSKPPRGSVVVGDAKQVAFDTIRFLLGHDEVLTEWAMARHQDVEEARVGFRAMLATQFLTPSKGSLCFSADGSTEYFAVVDLKGNVDVYRASTSESPHYAGRRHGRWECSMEHFKRNRDAVTGPNPIRVKATIYDRRDGTQVSGRDMFMGELYESVRQMNEREAYERFFIRPELVEEAS